MRELSPEKKRRARGTRDLDGTEERRVSHEYLAIASSPLSSCPENAVNFPLICKNAWTLILHCYLLDKVVRKTLHTGCLSALAPVT